MTPLPYKAWHPSLGMCPVESIHFKEKYVLMMQKGVGLRKVYFNEGVKIMQSTGKNDKNGKEIFDGDIVDKIHSCNFVVKVEPEGAFWYWYSEFADDSVRDYEIIGNIYQNPELLNPIK